MPIILLIIALCIFRYFEIWRFATMSWWWVIGLAGVAFLWFEFIEPMLGLDKRRAHDEDEKRRQARVKQNFLNNRRKR